MFDVKEVQYLGDYIQGEFHLPGANADSGWELTSPADLSDLVISPKVKNDNVDFACQSAKQAYLKWAHLPLEKRKEYLNRIKEIYLSYSEELAFTISRETGKPLWEAKTEAKAMAGGRSILL